MPSARETAQKLSIMSFNIAHGRGLSIYQGFHSSNGIKKNLEKISRLIKRHSPDIVAFQEIDQSSHWNRHIDLLKHIQGETGYPHAEHGIHNTRFGRKPLCYGNAFLSKYPISECIVTPFGNRNLGEKGFMDARFLVGFRSIDIINLHLDFGSRRARIAQIEPILERIKRFSESHAQDTPPSFAATSILALAVSATLSANSLSRQPTTPTIPTTRKTSGRSQPISPQED